MKNFSWLGGLMLSVSLLPTLGQAEPITVTHAKGEITLNETPKKVAVFDLASVDSIDALGVDVIAGLPKGEGGNFNAPSYLAAYDDEKYVGVGTLFEPDIEALKALAPDLIIIAGRSASKYEDVKAIAPTIDLSSPGQNFVEEAEHRTMLLGRIFDREELAAEKVAQMKAAVETMHAAAPKEAKGVVVFAMNDNYMLHAPGARFGGLYDFAGISSVMEPYVAPPKSDTPPPPRPAAGSPEAEAARQKAVAARDATLALNPDWIITLDRGAISSSEPSNIAQRMEKVEAFANTSAWKAGNVFHLDPVAWYLVGSGVQNLTLTAADITKLYQSK